MINQQDHKNEEAKTVKLKKKVQCYTVPTNVLLMPQITDTEFLLQNGNKYKIMVLKRIFLPIPPLNALDEIRSKLPDYAELYHCNLILNVKYSKKGIKAIFCCIAQKSELTEDSQTAIKYHKECTKAAIIAKHLLNNVEKPLIERLMPLFFLLFIAAASIVIMLGSVPM